MTTWTVPDVLRNLRDGEISLGRALELIKPFLKESTAEHDVPWRCDNCGHAFQQGAAIFDPVLGIVCPQCKSGVVDRRLRIIDELLTPETE